MGKVVVVRFFFCRVYFTDHSKAVPLLWITYVFFCLAFAMPLCASVCL